MSQRAPLPNVVRGCLCWDGTPSPVLAQMLFSETGWRQGRQKEAANRQTLVPRGVCISAGHRCDCLLSTDSVTECLSVSLWSNLVWTLCANVANAGAVSSDVTVCLVAMEMIVFNAIRSDVRVNLLLACCHGCHIKATRKPAAVTALQRCRNLGSYGYVNNCSKQRETKQTPAFLLFSIQLRGGSRKPLQRC